ncbi:chemotaxis protein CheR [Acetobacterium fimetarium]|uniref:protein-glutamate O-methyltransferase n=1 Tax=Acetobacterium fimetarium TaxID=52691 RepID=A0ABR6WRS3_9FIRM|nr:protein-glutamate O-methyltransferase CheR [Acetobacterium fimetarium]MBC3803220.1 chemotaxis protein CheR [Acetobacterium fimetarium]
MVSITENEFKELTGYIKNNYGIYLNDEKKNLVTGRLHHVLLENNCRNFSEFFILLKADKTGRIVNTLINKITTNYTFFMRESDHFTYFQDQVLPHLENTVSDHDLRIWSAGCSSGEEPYTLAMIIDKYFGNTKKFWDAKVLATDISDGILKKAKNGHYSKEQVSSLPIDFRMNYFNEIDGKNDAIIDRLKAEVIFRKFNLISKNFPFKKKFHVIFCRNVMIYFDNKTKIELVDKFYECMDPGGVLFIGHSESLIRDQTKFKYVLPAIYRKA